VEFLVSRLMIMGNSGSSKGGPSGTIRDIVDDRPDPVEVIIVGGQGVGKSVILEELAKPGAKFYPPKGDKAWPYLFDENVRTIVLNLKRWDVFLSSYSRKRNARRLRAIH